MKRMGWLAVVPGLFALLVFSGFMLRRAKSTLPSPPGTSVDAPGVLALYPGGSLTAGDVPSLTARELKAHLDRRDPVVLVFVGSRAYFDERHIPGAVCIDPASLEREFSGADRDDPIVVYCGCCAGASDGISGSAVRTLMRMGFRDVRHLAGHYAAWQEAGYPSDGTHPVPRFDTPWTEDDRRSIDQFAADADGRRRELQDAMKTETDSSRLRQLRHDFDREMARLEIEGLLLKRRLAEQSGNREVIRNIDSLLSARGHNPSEVRR